MISGIFKLLDGAITQQLRVENISNNLANMGTNGFKKSVISFDRALSMQNSTHVDLAPGPVVHTGNPFDVALDGDGFFKVMTARGIRYTRDGAFTLNSDGELVTRSGDSVLSDKGPVKIHGKQITIERDGRIVADGSPVGKLSLVEFNTPQGLKKEGRSYYIYDGDENDVVPGRKTNVQQGYIEKSNVDPTEEMVKMIEAFRTFEAIQKAIQNMDEVASKMINDSELV